MLKSQSSTPYYLTSLQILLLWNLVLNPFSPISVFPLRASGLLHYTLTSHTKPLAPGHPQHCPCHSLQKPFLPSKLETNRWSRWHTLCSSLLLSLHFPFQGLWSSISWLHIYVVVLVAVDVPLYPHWVLSPWGSPPSFMNSSRFSLCRWPSHSYLHLSFSFGLQHMYLVLIWVSQRHSSVQTQHTQHKPISLKPNIIFLESEFLECQYYPTGPTGWIRHEIIHWLIDSFSDCHVPDKVLGTGNTTLNKTNSLSSWYWQLIWRRKELLNKYLLC